jgi:hypothetical protein
MATTEVEIPTCQKEVATQLFAEIKRVDQASWWQWWIESQNVPRIGWFNMVQWVLAFRHLQTIGTNITVLSDCPFSATQNNTPNTTWQHTMVLIPGVSHKFDKVYPNNPVCLIPIVTPRHRRNELHCCVLLRAARLDGQLPVKDS